MIVQQSAGTYGELVEAQHVHDAYLGNDCSKKVRPLGTAGSYQKAAIRASLHDIQMTLRLGLLTRQVVTIITTLYTSMMQMTMTMSMTAMMTMPMTATVTMKTTATMTFLARDELDMCRASLSFQSIS